MEELKNSLVYTTWELEQTKLIAQDEVRKRDDQLVHLKDLLSKVISERNAAQEKCQRLLYEKILLQQQEIVVQQHQVGPLSGISSIEDEPRKGIDSNNGFSSSDCEESIVSSPQLPQTQQQQQPEVLPEKPLPEKGKLLQAVMKAGPLLQTLLLAGPLPQWRHPPPPLDSFEIPPVTIPSASPPQPQVQDSSFCNNNNNILNNCAKVNRKRLLSDGSESPTETKYQRLILH